MTTDCRQVKICVILGLSVLAVGPPVHKLLNAFIGSIHYSKTHQPIVAPFEDFVQNIDAVAGMAMQKHNYVNIVVYYGVVKRAEVSVVKFVKIAAVLEQLSYDLALAAQACSMHRRHARLVRLIYDFF